MSYTDYMNDLSLYGDSTAKNFTDLTCTIIQDDKDIAVKMVGIETSISDSNTKTEESLTFTAEYYGFEAYYDTPPAQREKQDFVTDISASSFLAGSYLMSSNTEGKSENSNAELFRSTYKPETSFDGSVYNGWVEGVKSNGKGEWISFTLTKSALGPFAANGLTRFSIYDYDFIYKMEINGNTYSSWFDNNRIASMTLRNLDTDAKTALRFKDIYPFNIHEYIPDGWFSINAVENPCFLAPGNYQMIIESSYKGDRYDDTVLGEVWFYPLGDTLAEILSDDASSRYTLYHKPLNACIERYIAQWHKLRKDSEQDLDK